MPSGPTTTTNWPPWLRRDGHAVPHDAAFAALDEEQIGARLREFGLHLAEHLVGIEVERRAGEGGPVAAAAFGRRQFAVEVHPRLRDLAVVQGHDQVDQAARWR